MSQSLPQSCRLLDFNVRGDERGKLVAIEGLGDVPFAIARAYYVYATTPGTVRGMHAHRALNQVAVAISGSCIMDLDDGVTRASVTLSSPSTAITLPPMVWHEMREFSSDCVLLVLADAPYDEADYIREYDTFKAEVSR